MSGRLNAANAVLTVPTVIGGRPIPFDETTARAVLDMCGAPALKLAVADKWTMVAAKGAASHAQAMLANVPREKIVNLLARAMDFYFPDRNAYRIMSGITGSPLPFVESGLEYVKDWCRSGRVFLDAALPQSTPHIGHIEYSNSRPVVAVLPSNSDQVAVYTVAQILYSRNACIVRGSSKGIGPWATYELANALSQAAAESNDEDCAVVASSLSVLNTELNYLDHLSVSGWNYLIFGSDESTRLFESDLRARCNPGKVLKFGTGLSQSVVLDDCDLAESASKVWESITINCGNECTSTDILYIQAGVCEQVLSSLSEKASSAPQTRSHDADVLGGVVLPDNCAYIKSQANDVRGKGITFCDGAFAPIVMRLHDYETAIEYPGPVVSVRSFQSLEHLGQLIRKDLEDNGMPRNLATSVFTSSKERLASVIPHVKAHTVRWNKGTEQFNGQLPHQGVYIVREFVEPIYIDAP